MRARSRTGYGRRWTRPACCRSSGTLTRRDDHAQSGARISGSTLDGVTIDGNFQVSRQQQRGGAGRSDAQRDATLGDAAGYGWTLDFRARRRWAAAAPSSSARARPRTTPCWLRTSGTTLTIGRASRSRGRTGTSATTPLRRIAEHIGRQPGDHPGRRERRDTSPSTAPVARMLGNLNALNGATLSLQGPPSPTPATISRTRPACFPSASFSSSGTSPDRVRERSLQGTIQGGTLSVR